MKIRLSLRLYVLGSLLFLVGSLVAIYATVTIQYFTLGLDFITRHTMIDVANTAVLDDAGQGRLLDYHVAERYEDVPAEVRRQFEGVDIEPRQLHKLLFPDSWFKRPQSGYFLMLITTRDGQPRFVSRWFETIGENVDIPWSKYYNPMYNPMVRAILFALFAVTVFTLLLLLILRSVSNPVEALRHWARTLNSERLADPAPDFRYSELNSLAEIIRSSLQSVKLALDREHDFLRHASHELRTPIATVRSNVELLRKLKSPTDERHQKVIDRIDRASVTMAHLTETLLWLSRDVDEPLPEQTIHLDQLVTQISQELQYLLQGKSVTVQVQTSPHTATLPQVAIQIMIANLIRNAFQHTQTGKVSIEQQGSRVAIINHNDTTIDNEPDELGFGLGLDLTRKLARRFGWHYRNDASADGHRAVVDFMADRLD